MAVRKSTMDVFRAQTQLWAAGGVDADSNFRPVQSNPSCVWVCADDYGDQWHYEDFLFNGPSTWADFSALCGHEQQSPILIDPAAFEDKDMSYEWSITHKGEHGHTLVYNNFFDGRGDGGGPLGCQSREAAMKCVHDADPFEKSAKD